MDIQTLRSYKIGTVAAFDLLATLLGAYLWYLYKKPEVSLPGTIVAFFILGIVVHYLLGVKTQFTIPKIAL